MKTLFNRTYMRIARRVVMVVAMALVVGNVWGATYSWTLASGDFGTTSTPATSISGKGSPAMSWNASYTWSKNKYIGFDSNDRGLQIGAGPSSGNNRHVTKLVLSTSGISGTITSITIETAGASGVTATIGVVVGSTTFKNNGNNTASLTSSNASYTFIGSASGTITLTWTQSTTSKALYIKSISVTYTPPAYTVTFDAHGGRLDGSDFTRTSPSYQIDETSGDAGITLPHAQPSELCSHYDWQFAGWATAACSETSTAPRLYLPEETYHPTSNETLHAVYRREDDGVTTSTATFSYTKSDLTTIAGNASSSWWWLHTASGVEFYIDHYGIYDSSFDIDDSDGDGWAILDAHRRIKQVVFTAKTESDVLSDIAAYDGGESNLVTDGVTQTVTCTGNVTQLMMVAPSSGESKISTFTVTYYNTTFNSEPGCCDEDPVIGGTAQLKDGGTYSLTRVDVECTSATVQSNCEWTDYGFIWSESVNTTATLQLNSDGSAPSGVTKVQVGTSGDASSFNGSLEKSSFETGHTYYYRAYVKNCYYNGSYVYSNTSTLASFTPYAVSYDNNGGTGSIAPQIVNTGGSITLSDGTGFAAPTGYHFDHWALNSTSGSSYDASDSYSSITADATFYAIWAINSHTLAWNFTGGSSSETAGTHYTAAGTKDYGTALSYPSSGSMSRTGYTFAGWSTDASTMPDNDLTITASWNTISYDVTYHPNGGSDVSDRTYTIETATFSLPTPSKTGYTFGGWYDNSSCTGVAVSSIAVGSIGNREYWAKWTANTYTVVFNKNGGQGDNMSNQGFTYDAPAKALSRNEYTPAAGSHKYFAGWATSTSRASAGTVDYADQAEVRNLTSTANGTYNLYAVWKAHTYTNYRTTCITRYDITLDDGEVATTNNGSAQVSANGTKLAKMVAPAKTGYTLKGYYTAKSDGYKIADLEGVLQAGVSVSETEWTNSGGQWVKGGDAIFYAQWDVNTYDITLNREGAEDGDESVTLTYNSNGHDAITNPSKVGYTFGGWYSGVGGTGTLVIDAIGVLQNSVTIETVNWTDASGNWIKDGTATLYANWTAKSTTVSFDTNSGTGATSDKTATYDAAMPTPITVPTRSGYYFGGYYDGEGGTGTQYYTASGASAKNWDKEDGSLKLYARWYGDLKAWCDPNVTVSGDIHLTSYKDLFVQSSSTAGNALNVTSIDWGSATEMEIAYLGAGDTEVAKGDSHFRLYGDNTNTAVDASSSSVDISASRTFNTDYSIRYTPSAFNTTNTYKLQLTFKKGEYTLKTVTHNLYGRGLPEEFVIAVKNSTDGYWYALPNTMASDNSSHTAPIKILVDDTTTPTSAVYAATTTVYKGQERNTANSNMQSIRFTTDGNNHLQASISTGTSNSTLKLPTSNLDGNQAFHLRSSNLAAYTVSLDPSATPAKKLGLYTSSSTMYMGYNESPSDYTIYFLPITNKYTPRDATAYEWGEHGVIVEADMTDVASATMHIDGASPTAATVTGINGSLGGTKYAKVDGGALTVGAVENDGKLLYIHWKNSGGDEIAASQITMPYVIAADATMSGLSTDKASWAKKEVHILPGKTLTADGASFDDSNVTVPTMYVYPGATLDITTGKLTATTLRLRSGWTRAGTKKYDVARVHIASGNALSKTTFTLDYDIYDSGEGKHYYPIAVPFPVAVSDVDYLDETLATASTYGKHYVIKRYDGASRAENGAIDDNWVVVPLKDAEDADVKLQPSEGYIMTGVGIPAYGGCIIRFPLDANDNWTNNGEKASYNTTTRNVIAVTHHTGAATTGGGANVRHEGWNLLANPYLSCFATDGNTTHAGGDDSFITGKMTLTGDPADPYGWDDDKEIYVSVPTHDFSEYIQSNIDDTELLPGWCFFIQAAKDGNVTFAVAGQQADSNLPIYAPRRNKAEESPIVKTGIVLSSEEASDKTTFLISDRYSDEYEIGADLEKMFGNGYTLATYSLNNGARLAFNAMSTAQANELIPIGVRLPEDGEYTFSLNEHYADADIERLDLIDYETGEVTDLMATDYIFYATRSQNDERFALNVQRGKQTPTDIGGADIGAPDGARKILLNGTIFIVRDGLLYDATGKRVQTNK